jgi:hypothetical protein
MSEWTVETLKEHLESLMEAQRSDLSHAIAQLSTSTKTYLAGGFAMHNSVNEFRATLSDQSKNFITKQAMWGYLVGAIGLAATLITLTVLFVKK